MSSVLDPPAAADAPPRTGWLAALGARPEVPLSIALFIFVVGGWELAVRVFDIPKIVVPTPSSVAVAMWKGIESGELVRHFWITFYEVIAGFVFGAAFGLVLGVADRPVPARSSARSIPTSSHSRRCRRSRSRRSSSSGSATA